ncbi:hypothetical protein L3X38_002267 [Prunus dulcis]|uniref:Uncharacterized protein n=1 Tax=Prunus dulcis TaxID=3755 RepID=A0AAD4WTQ6_PRUDU|nr:hypothetical protein L3X38_002267 [Prunus dulcis]
MAAEIWSSQCLGLNMWLEYLEGYGAGLSPGFFNCGRVFGFEQTRLRRMRLGYLVSLQIGLKGFWFGVDKALENGGWSFVDLLTAEGFSRLEV